MNMPPAQTSNERHQDASKPASPAQTHGVPEDREDALWVERSVKGDPEAFERLFEKYRQKLFGVAWRITGNEDAGLDVVQEAFVKAFERLKDLRGETRFYPWLRQIAVHLAIDRIRHIKRGVEVSFDEAQFGSGEGADAGRAPVVRSEQAERDSPEKKAELAEFSRDLQEALKKLSEPQRVVFHLHASEGMTYKEIADALGCNMGTVMSRLFYARKKLQELLASHLKENDPAA